MVWEEVGPELYLPTQGWRRGSVAESRVGGMGLGPGRLWGEQGEGMKKTPTGPAHSDRGTSQEGNRGEAAELSVGGNEHGELGKCPGGRVKGWRVALKWYPQT